jgi:glycosyltransferase involved in cell wall biosynthesis
MTRVALLTRAVRCGGVSTFLFRLGRELTALGFRVEIVTTEERGEWFDLAAAHGLRPSSIEGARAAPPWMHARRVGHHLRERGDDAILLNHAFHAQAALGMLQDRVFVVPILHNDIEEVVRVGLGNPAAWNVAVAVSPGVQEIARGRRPERPIERIAHGIAIPGETPARIERKREERPLRLAYVGAIEHQRKGVLDLPPILRGLRDRGVEVRLTIAGAGPDRRRLEAGFASAAVGDRVEWLGAVEPSRVREILMDAHILLLPSRHEGFGLVLIEAQACGCVPIASRLPGITDFAIDDGGTGILIDPAGPAGAANAVERLDRDRARWRNMAEAAFERTRERFEVGRMGSDYARLIRQGLDGRYPLARPRSELPPIDRDLLTWRGALPPRLLAALRRLRPVRPGGSG